MITMAWRTPVVLARGPWSCAAHRQAADPPRNGEEEGGDDRVRRGAAAASRAAGSPAVQAWRPAR
ncbi:hypothetical protein ACRAWF_19525 [Streptomyces sp. L7]